MDFASIWVILKLFYAARRPFPTSVNRLTDPKRQKFGYSGDSVLAGSSSIQLAYLPPRKSCIIGPILPVRPYPNPTSQKFCQPASAVTFNNFSPPAARHRVNE